MSSATAAKPHQLVPYEIGGYRWPGWAKLGLVGGGSRTIHGQGRVGLPHASPPRRGSEPRAPPTTHRRRVTASVGRRRRRLIAARMRSLFGLVTLWTIIPGCSARRDARTSPKSRRARPGRAVPAAPPHRGPRPRRPRDRRLSPCTPRRQPRGTRCDVFGRSSSTLNANDCWPGHPQERRSDSS
jgi:hypothetical protein